MRSGSGRKMENSVARGAGSCITHSAWHCLGAEAAIPSPFNPAPIAGRQSATCAVGTSTRNLMTIHLRPATLEDVAFLADVVVTATLAQERFPLDVDLVEYRAGYEEWTRETVLGAIPDCTLSVIDYDGHPVGRLRVVRTPMSITLAGIQLLPAYQNQRIGSTLIEQLKGEAETKKVPLCI